MVALATSILGGCAGGSGETPSSVVQRLYQTRINARMTGAPTPEELRLMAPYLSEQLRSLLRQARELHDAEAARSPDEKPAFADGDLFSSLFEGPTSLQVVAEKTNGMVYHVEVQFAFGKPFEASWTDDVTVILEKGRYVVADVQYGGRWDFGNKGALVASLKRALSRGC